MIEKRSTRKESKKQTPEIAVVGEISDEGENEIINSLLEVEPGEEVTLYIDSAGGSVYAALAIGALIRMRKLKATAVVLGECSSSAILIFASCKHRMVTPRSVFLFHRVKWRSEKDVRSEEAVNWASHFHWLEREVDRYQAELLGGSFEAYSEWVEKGRFVLGTELVQMGIAELVEV